jgi:type I restriction enzyme, S subunit
MTRATFFKHFELLADQPDAVAKLRELVLELAVQGKVVTQNPKDESAEVLMTKVRAAKQRLTKELRIKELAADLPIKGEDKKRALPSGWAWAKLADLCIKLGAGSTPLGGKQIYETSGVKFLRSQNVYNDGLHLDDVAFIPPAIHKDMSGTWVQPGDILLNITGASIGRSAIVPDDFDEANVSQHVAIVRLAEKALRQFLHLVVIAPDFQQRIMDVQVGVSREGLSMTRLKEFVVAVPPLAEQRRIVAKVDELMALCDELEQRQQARQHARGHLTQSACHHLTAAKDPVEFRKRFDFILHNSSFILDDVPQLRQAILSLAVQGHLVQRIQKEGLGEEILNEIGATPITPTDAPFLPDHWKWASLGDLVVKMDSGWSPACPPEPAGDNEWGVLKTTAVQSVRYLQEHNKVLPMHLKPRPEHEVIKGDILITRAGPKNRVGISCVVETTRPRLMISDKIVRFQLRPIIFPRFAALCLNAGYSSEVLERLKSGMAESQMNISQPKLKTTPLPVPPLAEQKRIVARVAELLRWCDTLEAQLHQTRTLGAHLLASTLHHLLAA